MSDSPTPRSKTKMSKKSSKKMSSKLRLNNNRSGDSLDGDQLAEIDEDGHENIQIDGGSDAHTEPLDKAMNALEELDSKFLLKYEDMLKEVEEEPVGTFKLKADNNRQFKHHF